MASKRKTLAAREPNGRIQREHEHEREQELAPTAIRRLKDAALRRMCDPEWGSELGRLYLEGALTASQYAAGRKWRQGAAEYRGSIGVFPVRSVALQRGIQGHEVDPDSPEGQKQATRERNGAERFFAAHARLALAGGLAESVVRRICEEDEAPCGFAEHQALRKGLTSLVDHYNLTREPK